MKSLFVLTLMTLSFASQASSSGSFRCYDMSWADTEGSVLKFSSQGASLKGVVELIDEDKAVDLKFVNENSPEYEGLPKPMGSYVGTMKVPGGERLINLALDSINVVESKPGKTVYKGSFSISDIWTPEGVKFESTEIECHGKPLNRKF